MGSKVIRNVTKILKATSGRLFGRVTSGTGRGEELTPSDVRTLIAFDESVDDRVSALLAAGTNITITYNDASNTLTIASTAGGLSGTGSVDNAVLRADGTGGATLQASAIVIDDLYTASPNNTVNVVCVKPTGGTTNVGVAIVPNGTGSFSLAVPDGTATGGNARGANAVDLTTTRFSASWVASGAASFAAGESALASGANAVSLGKENTASGQCSFATGLNAQAQALCSTASGRESFATVSYAFASGYNSRADRYGQYSHAAGIFSANGDAQSVGLQARNKTTSAVATELFLNGSSTRLTIPSGKVLSALVRVTGVKSDGSEVIKFLRDVTIKNVGGTTSLEAAVVAIGSDINVSGATLNLAEDNTNDSLKIEVTPPTGTWRWHAIVECANEIAYGT